MNNLLIKAQANIAIVIETPLSIGDAEVQATGHDDEDKNEDEDECLANTRRLPRDCKNRPYIPAASLKGALRQMLVQAALPAAKINTLLGQSLSNNKAELQSGVCRVYPGFASTDITTQVIAQTSVDEITGASKDNQLFEREYITSESELNFELEAEFIDASLWHELLSVIHNQSLQLGAGSKNDNGRSVLTVVKNRGMTASDITSWLKQDATMLDSMLDLGLTFSSKLTKQTLENNVEIAFFITSDDPILVNDPARLAALSLHAKQTHNTQPQKLKDQYMRLDKQGQPYLPASSLRGALRAQYRRIVRTVLLQHPHSSQRVEEIVEHLSQSIWGSEQQKAGIRITNANHVGVAFPHHQTSIAIDRFSGRVKNGAMLEIEGVTVNKFKFTLTLTPKLLEPQYTPQRSILLFLIRDMFEQDISIGAHKNKVSADSRFISTQRHSPLVSILRRR